jgi:hypothetical protein
VTALSPELSDFIQPGLAGMVAAADGERRAHAVRVWAARLLGPSTLELYVLRAPAGAFLAALSEGSRAAANLIEVSTYRSRAFKGTCRVSSEPLDPEHLRQCLDAADVVFEAVGLGKDGTSRMLAPYDEPHDMVSLWLEVDAVYDQSPKPGAGARL